MAPDASNSARSIPRTRGSVKQAIADVLAGLPVVDTEFAVDVTGVMSAEEFYLAFGRLMTVERSVMLRCRFKSGDLWNVLHGDDHKLHLKRFMAMLSSKMNADQLSKYLKRMRQCGWVAHKWEPGDRSDKHSWTWYVENPKSSGSADGSGLPFYLMSRCVDDETIECVGSGDKHIAVRIPSGYRIAKVAE